MVDFLKENWIGLLTLIVAVATFIVSLLAYRYTRNRDKKHLHSLIDRKQAQLDDMKRARRAGFNMSEIGSIDMDIAKLEAEVEQLKDEL